MRSLVLRLCVLAAIVTFALSAQAQPPVYDVTDAAYGADPNPNTANDDDGDAIRAAIADADADVAGSVVLLPTGDYEVGDDPATWIASLYLNGVSDVTIRGEAGTTVHFQNRNRHGFFTRNCTNVRFENMTLRYDGLCHLEGEITAYTATATHPVTSATVPMYTVELSSYFQSHFGDPFLFATSDIKWSFYAYDAYTRRLKRKSSQMKADWIAPASDGVSVEVYLVDPDSTVQPSAMNIDVGDDLAVIAVERSFNNANGIASGHMIHGSKSTGTIFEDITILNSPFFAAQHDFDSAIEYHDCKIIPDPDVDTFGALISTNRDGLRFIGNRVGPTIEGCTFERNGDDALNIRANWHEITVVRSTGSTYTLRLVHTENPAWQIDIRDMDTLQFVDPVHLTVDSTATVSGTPTAAPGGGLDVQVVAPSPVPSVGDLVTVVEANSDGFAVTGNTVRETRARAFLVRGTDGTISDNVIAGTTLPGIAVSPHLSFFNESDFSQNLLISGNTIHNVGYKRWGVQNTSTDLGALTIGLGHSQTSWPSAARNESITIVDNWISTGRLVGLFLGSVDTVDVEDNHILSCQLDPVATAGSTRGIPTGAADGMLHLQHGIDVSHEGNVIDTQMFTNQIPAHSITSATGTDGNALEEDLNETGSGDAVYVYSTSFEQEEDWSPALPSFGSGSPTGGGTYKVATSWSATIDGVPFSFSDWGLFGNHYLYHHYRGYISSLCKEPDGSIVIDPPSAGTLLPSKLELWAAANTPPGTSGTWTLEVEVQLSTGGGYQTVASVSPSTLPYPPTFEHLTYNLPQFVDKIRLRRPGGTTATPYLYVDDIVIHYKDFNPQFP